MENAKDPNSTGYVEDFNGDGYVSLAIVYAVGFFVDFVSASIIAFLGTKLTLILGSSTYALFIASFYALRAEILYFGSALLGIGAAMTWVSQVINISNIQSFWKEKFFLSFIV